MDPRPFTIRDAVNGVRSRSRLVCIIFALVLVLVGIATLLAQKKYQSEAQIFVRLGRENIGLDPTMTLGEKSVVTAPMAREAEINSITHMIRSRNLLESVVDDIGPEAILKGRQEGDSGESGSGGSIFSGLAKTLVNLGVLNDVSPRERAVIKLDKKLKVKTLDRSNVVLVSYEAKSPEMAQAVVKSLVAKYLEWHVKMHRTLGTKEILERQVVETAKQLALKESEFESFKTRTGMISSELSKEQLVSRMGVIKNHLLDANVVLASLEKEIGEMQASLDNLPSAQVVSKTVGAGNEGVDGMRQELYRQEIELEFLLARHTPRHPRVVALKKSIDNAKKILQQDEEQRTEAVVGANPVYDELLVELLTKRPLLEAARAKSDFLEKELKTVEGTLASFSHNERIYMKLTRELGIIDEKYRRQLRSVAQTDIDSSLEQNQLSNISISQPPTYVEKPVRPNKLINLIVGLVFGVCASFGTAIFLEYMSTTLRTTEDVESTLAAPIIATVPRMSLREVAVQVEDS